jgi:hypothetical protein
VAEFVIAERPLRCQVCADLIGIFEPLIVRDSGRVWHTSVAADPGVSPMIGEHYHQACYDTQLADYTFPG